MTTDVAAYLAALGTLVLAVATFASVRSASAATRTAQLAYRASLRPLLFPSRLEDPVQQIRWGDDHWAHLAGGSAVVEADGEVVYLALSLRNVGAGLAVIDSWRLAEWTPFATTTISVADLEDFRVQRRDLYIAAGDNGFWQAAVRDVGHPWQAHLRSSIEERTPLLIDIVYGDHEGGQRTMGRFLVSPIGPPEHPVWHCSVVRHSRLGDRELRPVRRTGGRAR